MAESTTPKDKKTRDSFADDLDSMLDIDDSNEQQIGLIDDDDAIDRLLIGDAFADTELDEPSDDFGTLDKMMTDVEATERLDIGDIDEFGDDLDDMIAKLDINPKQQNDVSTEPPLDLSASKSNDVEAFDIEAHDDDLIDDAMTGPSQSAEDHVDDAENMREIDEFSDDTTLQATDSADFLLADFNISSDDEAKLEDSSPPPPRSEDQFFDDASSETLSASWQGVDEFTDETVPAIPEPVNIAPPAEPVSPPRESMDHSAALAGLTTQLQALAKSQKQTQHDLQLKADQETLNGCLESIEALQTEQKKARRSLDGLLNQKPTGVYVANGVAALAMMVAIGLGVESYITKSQLGQLVEIIEQIKQQADQGPANDAAAAELLRKQVEELSVAQGVLGNQIAELTKAIPIGPTAGKASGDMAELNERDMQMGAAIEALQSKVAALEKGRSAATAPKPVAKKPEIVDENWAVNLVAFKQDWYARRKAEEFAAKDVPAKVVRSDSKGETWYRLTVDGFKNQAEANAYAAKAKKTLNLDSVWVAKIKE